MKPIKKISNYFLLGVLAVVPLVLVLQIVVVINRTIARLFTSIHAYTQNFSITVFVSITTIVLLSLIGYNIAKFGRSFIILWIERVIERIPVLKTVYRVTKKVIELVKSPDEDKPKQVVYIEYPKEGLWVPAYVTNQEDDMYVVYVPTSPNPTSGFTLIVHESKVVKSAMNVEEVTSFIVSVGVDFHKADEVKELKK